MINYCVIFLVRLDILTSAICHKIIKISYYFKEKEVTHSTSNEGMTWFDDVGSPLDWNSNRKYIHSIVLFCTSISLKCSRYLFIFRGAYFKPFLPCVAQKGGIIYFTITMGSYTTVSGWIKEV